MQFLLLAYDATDDDALNRRMAARQAHLDTIERYRLSGNMHMGAAICDDSGKMVGSCIVCEFPSREALDSWLATEPYVAQKVWDKVTVTEAKIGPSFLKK
jgi:uncharacterized protein YciI